MDFYRSPPAAGPRGHARARPATGAVASLLAASNLAAVAGLRPKRRRGWDPALHRDAPGSGRGGGAGAGAALDGTAAAGSGRAEDHVGGGAAGEGQGAISWRSFGELLPASS